MKKVLIIAAFVCFAGLRCLAQTVSVTDKELASLVDVVKMLRDQSETTYKKAVASFKADKKWTPMNETGVLQKSECRPSDKVSGFKLNRILTTAERDRKYVSTHGDMLNGEDSRYNYSLFERTLKKGGKATYTLRGRVGAQTLVLVPFCSRKGSLVVTVNGKRFTQDTEDGTLVCPIPASSVKNETVSLTVENRSGMALPFVIINHNSRKK